MTMPEKILISLCVLTFLYAAPFIYKKTVNEWEAQPNAVSRILRHEEPCILRDILNIITIQP